MPEELGVVGTTVGKTWEEDQKGHGLLTGNGEGNEAELYKKKSTNWRIEGLKPKYLRTKASRL